MYDFSEVNVQMVHTVIAVMTPSTSIGSPLGYLERLTEETKTGGNAYAFSFSL